MADYEACSPRLSLDYGDVAVTSNRNLFSEWAHTRAISDGSVALGFFEGQPTTVSLTFDAPIAALAST